LPSNQVLAKLRSSCRTGHIDITIVRSQSKWLHVHRLVTRKASIDIRYNRKRSISRCGMLVWQANRAQILCFAPGTACSVHN